MDGIEELAIERERKEIEKTNEWMRLMWNKSYLIMQMGINNMNMESLEEINWVQKWFLHKSIGSNLNCKKFITDLNYQILPIPMSKLYQVMNPKNIICNQNYFWKINFLNINTSNKPITAIVWT